MADMIFDVVAEYPKEPEIAHDVKQVGMQKHRGEDGEERRRKRVLWQPPQRAGQVLGNESELKYQGSKVTPSLQLYWNFKQDVHQHVQQNNEVVDERCTEA